MFGMELLAQLDIGATNNFFRTFFSLPDFYWRGFLASSLSSGHLLAFAFLTMIKAPPGIQFKLMKHLITDPAGMYLLRTYAGRYLLRTCMCRWGVSCLRSAFQAGCMVV